jgi:hypothetical protein
MVKPSIKRKRIISRKEAKAQNLPRYFTGKPCPYGHICERRTSGSNCLQCESEWFSKNASHVADYKREWVKRDIEAARKRALRWWRTHAETEKQKSRQRHADNPEHKNAPRRKWRKENAQYLREYYRKYRAANVLAIKAAKINSSSKRRAAPGRHTAADIRNLVIVQENLCTYCQCDLAVSGFHVDHIQPLARGGTNNPDNLCLSCPTCNVRKQDMNAAEFIARLAQERLMQ